MSFALAAITALTLVSVTSYCVASENFTFQTSILKSQKSQNLTEQFKLQVDSSKA